MVTTSTPFGFHDDEVKKKCKPPQLNHYTGMDQPVVPHPINAKCQVRK